MEKAQDEPRINGFVKALSQTEGVGSGTRASLQSMTLALMEYRGKNPTSGKCLSDAEQIVH